MALTREEKASIIGKFEDTTGYRPGVGFGMIDVTKVKREYNIPVQPGANNAVPYTTDFMVSAAPTERVEVEGQHGANNNVPYTTDFMVSAAPTERVEVEGQHGAVLSVFTR